MFCDPDEPRKTFPRLKGKAAEIKHLMPALVWVWGHSMDRDNEQHKQILLALQCSCFLDQTLDAHKDCDVLPTEDAERFKHAGFALNINMNALETYYGNLGINSEFLFNIVPKNHYLAHICLCAGFVNPRMAWCYMGEDMMHQMRRLSSGCVRGNSPQNASLKLVAWYRHGLSRMLSDRV
jgi:hypothetical protein